MAKISVLPEHIASQIAAGEVVERPASVVKELVENSIDAGATRIEISAGGDCLDIRVADNGSGMEPDDAVLAFHRHATSKLASADDLWKLRTMGFRGEALPSIAAVARINCFTRTAGASTGTRLQAADGQIETTETGCAPGTVIDVTDLFYNVPARLKFLKKASTEFAHIYETVQALAIAFPEIAFQLLNGGETVFKTSGSGKLEQALVESRFLSGKESLCPVAHTESEHGLAVNGCVARPMHFRGDRKGILAIVNKRPVRCHLSYKALDYAFQDLIPRGRYPLAVLAMSLDPALVDVNVHPTKKEIKYTNGNDIYRALQRGIAAAVRQATGGDAAFCGEEFASPKPELAACGATDRPEGRLAEGSSPVRLYSTAGDATPAVKESPYADYYATQRSDVISTEQIKFTDSLSYAPLPVLPDLDRVDVAVPSRQPDVARLPAGWRLLGYLKNTYIILETAAGLIIVEQHIAHERVLYEQLLASQATPARLADSCQRLVISVPLDLSADQKSIVQSHMDKLRNIGFDFEFDGDAGVICTQVPIELAHKEYATVVQSIIEDLRVTGAAELALEATKSVACQAAVKNGMALAEPDIRQLLDAWQKTPRNDTCPHGRPIKIELSMEKLFQMFHYK